MHSGKTSPRALITALSVLMTLSACAGLGNKPPATIPPDEAAALIIPELSAEDARPCYDPGVPDGADALVVIADTRVALADCARRHGRVVDQYNDAIGILQSGDAGSASGGS